MEGISPLVGRTLIALGIALIVAGGLLLLLPRLPSGQLPGDLHWNRSGYRIHVPLGTMVVISLVLTVLVNALLHLFRRLG